MGRPSKSVGSKKKRAVKWKRRASKLDAHAEQLEMWLATMDYRTAAQRAKDRLGIDIHWTNLARWHKARTQRVTLQTLQRSDAQIAVTKNLIESEWAKQIAEFKAQHDAAKSAGDFETATRYAALWFQAVKTGVAHFFPKPPDVLVQQQVHIRVNQARLDVGRALMAVAKRALESEHYAALVEALRKEMGDAGGDPKPP